MPDADIDHPIVAALYDRVVPESWLFAPHRRYLADGLSGRILDLGAGTGAMIPHLAAHGSAIEYHGIEPDPNMRSRARNRAADLDLAVTIESARAESLPYPDGQFDVVLASLVFCTIGDPDAAVAEVARVLKPGGEFRFFEHIHADGRWGTAQDIVNPVWERAAGGCQLNRDTVSRFVGHEAFDVLEVERLEGGALSVPAIPFVRGRLRRRKEECQDSSIER